MAHPERAWKLRAPSHRLSPIHLFIWCSSIAFVMSLIVNRKTVEEEENHHISYLEVLQKGQSEFHV
uniref:Uncharacterized protein n=1 Tax=Homo sapiens TaxID=9606 RepID=B4XZE3_HUMAN|nr:unknown [Homo sapiens]